MSLVQFDALTTLARTPKGTASRELSRLHAVDGIPIKDAALLVGISRIGGYKAIQRMRNTLGLAQVAVGPAERPPGSLRLSPEQFEALALIIRMPGSSPSRDLCRRHTVDGIPFKEALQATPGVGRVGGYKALQRLSNSFELARIAVGHTMPPVPDSSPED